MCWNLSDVLNDVFNVPLASGVLPHNWKLVDITPLHKKAAKIDRKNYHPVSLTSVTFKGCEMTVRYSSSFSFGLQTRSLFRGNLAS